MWTKSWERCEAQTKDLEKGGPEAVGFAPEGREPGGARSQASGAVTRDSGTGGLPSGPQGGCRRFLRLSIGAAVSTLGRAGERRSWYIDKSSTKAR